MFPYDKLLHFMFGTYMAILLSSIMAWWLIVITVLILAVGVEIYDKSSGKGTPEVLDIIYTLAGSGCVLVINLI